MTAPHIPEDVASSIFRPREVITPDTLTLSALAPSVRDAPDEGVKGPTDSDEDAELAALAGETPADESEPEETPPPAQAQGQETEPAPTAGDKPRLAVPHTDRMARLARQLMEGSPDVSQRARATLSADPYGQQIVESWDRSRSRIAATDGRVLTDAERTFSDLEKMRVSSPLEFGRVMADKRWRQWYDAMEEWTQSPADDGADRDPIVDAAWNALQARPGADLLSEEDWEQVDPDPGVEPATAVVDMTSRFERLVARRRIEQSRKPLAARAERLTQENNALRRARSTAPPAVGAAGQAPTSLSSLHDKFLEGVEAGTTTRAQREAYYRARSEQRANANRSPWPF